MDELEDKELNPIPVYLDNAAGSVLQRRAIGADVRDDVFKIQKKLPFSLSFIATMGLSSASVTLAHGLNYRPLPQGYYKVITTNSTDFPIGQRGFIPEYRQYFTFGFPNPDNWTVWIDNIDESFLTLNIKGAGLGAFTGSISGTILLFRELAI